VNAWVMACAVDTGQASLLHIYVGATQNSLRWETHLQRSFTGVSIDVFVT
jgi:hypothetical protein